MTLKCLRSFRLNIIGLASILFLQACASVSSKNTLPESLESQVQVQGFTNIRAWGDEPSKVLVKSAMDSIQQERAANHGRLLPDADALSLSGGGQEGAFGAGLLCGWSKTGKRPQFKLVTGISTGSLMAPFVFLGPSYDNKLKMMYTTITDKDIYSPYSGFTLLMSLFKISSTPSMADSKPLANLIAKYIDSRVLKNIAAEHKKGRRLLVGTSQLDAQRLVIWDMGAIASSHSAKALDLFRQILLASASIPATFPPQIINVVAKGKPYQEMHVDGGVEVQVMLFENAILPFSSHGLMLKGQRKNRKLYILRNESIFPRWESTKPELQYIAIRSIDSLIKSQSIGDLYRLYTYTQRDNFEYNLAYVPHTFTDKPKSEFDKDYMTKLFNLGYNLGRSGYEWHHLPPGFILRTPSKENKKDSKEA